MGTRLVVTGIPDQCSYTNTVHWYKINNTLTVHKLVSEAIVKEVQLWFGSSLASGTYQDPIKVNM